MANTDFHLGNAGSILHLTFKKDGVAFPIDSAQKVVILIRKKNGVILEKEAIFETNGTDGKVYYTFIPGELDIVGEWKVQGYVRFDTDHIIYTSIVPFQVESNLAVASL